MQREEKKRILNAKKKKAQNCIIIATRKPPWECMQGKHYYKMSFKRGEDSKCKHFVRATRYALNEEKKAVFFLINFLPYN